MYIRADEQYHEGLVIRPPSEAESLIVQLTLGCSDNRCSFCPAYKQKKFSVKDSERIERELQSLARSCPETRRLFFADGDALAAPQETLLKAFDAANRAFPMLTRISLYGSPGSVEKKTCSEITALKERKLKYVYIGLESGDEQVYASTGKYGSPQAVIAACRKIADAGARSNVTVILGLGGAVMSRQHARGTTRALNAARPDQIAALSLIIAPGTPLHAQRERGEFKELDEFGHVAELREIIAGLDDFKCRFFSNHASNYFEVSARMPRDRETVLAALDRLLRERDPGALRPGFLRGL